jgi:hypothetical protein
VALAERKDDVTCPILMQARAGLLTVTPTYLGGYAGSVMDPKKPPELMFKDVTKAKELRCVGSNCAWWVSEAGMRGRCGGAPSEVQIFADPAKESP